MVEFKGSGSPIIRRGYNLVIERKGEERGSGSKIYFSPVNFLIGRALRTGPETLKNRFGMSENEFEDLKGAIAKKEGYMNLINAGHSDAITGKGGVKLPKVRDEYLEGVVKSKERGFHEVTVKRPFLLKSGELLLNDVDCSCGDKIHSTKKGGAWSSNVVCVHSSALWDDFAEYTMRKKYGNENLNQKNGWILDDPLRNELFVPFTFMEYDPEGKSEQADELMKNVIEKRYFDEEKIFDLNKELLKNSRLFSKDLENLIEDGEIGFEVIQQDRKLEDQKNDYVTNKNRMAKNIDNKLAGKYGLGFYRSGKCLEEGLPADRYEHPEKDLAINVVYSDEYPPFLAVKKLGDEVNLDGDRSEKNPYRFMGTTKERVDDKTRRISDVRYCTPNRILWPDIPFDNNIDINVDEIIKKMSRDAIEEHSIKPDYSTEVCGLEN